MTRLLDSAWRGTLTKTIELCNLNVSLEKSLQSLLYHRANQVIVDVFLLKQNIVVNML